MVYLVRLYDQKLIKHSIRFLPKQATIVKINSLILISFLISLLKILINFAHFRALFISAPHSMLTIVFDQLKPVLALLKHLLKVHQLCNDSFVSS